MSKAELIQELTGINPSFVNDINTKLSNAEEKFNDFLSQGCIQVCFDSVQPLSAPKKTAQIFLQVQINNHIFH